MPVRIIEPAPGSQRDPDAVSANGAVQVWVGDDAGPPRRSGRVRIIEPAGAPPPPAAGRKPTSQALGFYQGAMKPFDNAAMALEAGANRLGVPTQAINAFLGAPSAAQATTAHRNALANAPARPGVAGQIAGEIVGTLPVLAATRNPALVGAGQGALLTDARDPMGVALDAGVGAALGHYGGKLVDAAADAIKPVIDPAVQRLRDAGVSLTPGMVRGGKAMVREDKAMSRPIVGDMIAEGRAKTQATFNTASVNEALKPLGVKVPSNTQPGFDSIAYAKGQIGRAYDAVIPNLAIRMDPERFVQNVGDVGMNLKPAQQQHLVQIVSNELGKGQLAGDALKRAQSNIRRLAGKFARSQDANDQLLGDALRAVDDELTQTMIAQNPRYAPQLQKVNSAYRGYRIVADAASRADDGVFNTGQLKQAVRRGDFSKSKDAAARGQAFMQDFSSAARQVIPAKTPDSGTAGRLQAKGVVENLRGALEAAGYKADEALQHLRMLPRPAAAAPAAQAVKRLKRPVSAGAVASAHTSRD